jgi:hypothetical protein
MNTTGKSAGILSLSAASIALLQSAVSTDAQPTKGANTGFNNAQNGQIISMTDRVILEPPFQKQLNQLYADHTSHSSHASHSSHTSGMSDPTPSTPYYAPYTAPATYPTPAVYPTAPRPQPAPVVAAATNSISATNSVDPIAARKSRLESLKKEAAKGSADAQYALALYYQDGYGGCEKNVEKAKMLLELSAIQGNADAQKSLDKLEPALKAESDK